MGDRRCGERGGVEQFREGLIVSRLSLGFVLFVISAAGALINAWAFRAFPREWGGPNIGGGALQLLFYIGIVASLFLIGSALRRNRRGSK